MLKKEFEFEIASPVCICDIEICNDIKQADGSWKYELSDIITLGIFYGKKITILQKEKTDSEKSWKENLLKELDKKPVMFCLNVKMEKYGLKGFLGLNRFFEEIQPFSGRGCSKDNLFNDLINNNLVPKKLIPIDPFKGNSRLVLDRYLENKYEDIINHNKSCLIKEYFIFINRFWFLNKYEEFINRSGWWDAENPFGAENPQLPKGDE